MAALWAVVSCGDGGADPACSTSGAALRVLVFSRTTGFRHDSIPAGIDAICALGAGRGWQVAATESPQVFTAAGLLQYDVVVWLNTTGDVLDAAQESAFRTWVEAGGGFVGIHSAADTEYGWVFYGELLGAYFSSHPAVQPATVEIEDSTHPATALLPVSWVRTDEWYDFQSNPRGTVQVLARVSEQSYTGGGMGADHPIVWCHPQGAGRAFYSGMGHTEGSYTEPLFLEMIAGAITWAGGG